MTVNGHYANVNERNAHLWYVLTDMIMSVSFLLLIEWTHCTKRQKADESTFAVGNDSASEPTLGEMGDNDEP